MGDRMHNLSSYCIENEYCRFTSTNTSIKYALLQITFTVMLILTLAGCKTDDSTPTNNNNNNGGNNSGTLKITGVSPERPFPDDVFTVTGSGFSDNDTANHLRLFNLEGGRKDLVILSATSTEIKARIPLEDTATYLPSGWRDGFMILVGGDTAMYDKQVWFHAPLRVTNIKTHGTFVWQGVIPGKQVELKVRGHDPSTGLSVSVAGKQLQVDSVTEYSEYTQYSIVYCSVTPDLIRPAPVPWPSVLCDSIYTVENLVIQSNGRLFSREVGVYIVAEPRYDSLGTTSIPVETLNKISSQGGSAFVMIHGKNLFGIARTQGNFPEQVIGGYTDEFAYQIGGTGWSVPNRGTYQIIITTGVCNGIPSVVVCGTFTVY
jgi:hypothetical protein